MTNNRHLNLLKQDVKAWNCWREENRGVNLDFSGTNLSYLNLSGVNLSGVNLSGVNFRGTNLKCAYLKGANLYRACLVNANISGSDLSEVQLTEANLTKADISFADLTNANLTKVNAVLTNFEKSILTGACLENWQIDSSTNLEALVCDYFYGKSHNQQRYPQDEQQNFVPGEYNQSIRNNFDYIDAIVLASSHSESNDRQKVKQNKNIIESINNDWEKESENSQSPLISSNTPRIDKLQKKDSIVNLSLAFLSGIIITMIALGRLFEQAPTSSDNFMNCENSLLKQAEDAILTQDEESLKQAMKKLEEFNSPLGGFADEQCRQTLYKVKYVYAIQIKATKENNLLEAVAILCELPEQFYQNREYKPWFTHWANSFTAPNFPQQLEKYIENNSCPANNYLN